MHCKHKDEAFRVYGIDIAHMFCVSCPAHDLSFVVMCVMNARSLHTSVQDRGTRWLCSYLPPARRFFPSFINQTYVPCSCLYCTARCTRYNLGWLPGGDKSITTKLEDTLESIEAAKPLVKHGGMISVMLYKGHAEVSKHKRKAWKAFSVRVDYSMT